MLSVRGMANRRLLALHGPPRRRRSNRGAPRCLPCMRCVVGASRPPRRRVLAPHHGLGQCANRRDPVCPRRSPRGRARARDINRPFPGLRRPRLTDNRDALGQQPYRQTRRGLHRGRNPRSHYPRRECPRRVGTPHWRVRALHQPGEDHTIPAAHRSRRWCFDIIVRKPTIARAASMILDISSAHEGATIDITQSTMKKRKYATILRLDVRSSSLWRATPLPSRSCKMAESSWWLTIGRPQS